VRDEFVPLPRRRFLLAATCAATPFALPRFAAAELYPTRPITMVVPFAAGGGTDVLGRILADGMRVSLGQPVIVENVAGAAGSIGVARAVRAPADGYTLSMGTSTSHVLIGGLYTLPFDLLTDLAPISELAAEPLLVVIRGSLPAVDLHGFITWLKANPDKATAGTAGVGATGHLAGLAFQKMTGTRYQFIPYRGNGPAVQDLIAGQIDFMIEPSSNFLAQVRAGTIRALAVTANSRSGTAPQIPTVDEAGLPGFHASLWFGLWVPRDTPPDIVAKLNAAVVDALADAKVRARIADLGPQIVARERQNPQALAALQKADIEKWWPIIKAANIRGG
jgi:tripartite-type tricarboxylate transporter receptor subunit TctC